MKDNLYVKGNPITFTIKPVNVNNGEDPIIELIFDRIVVIEGKLSENFLLIIDGYPISKYNYEVTRKPNDPKKLIFKITNLRDNLKNKNIQVTI